MKTRDENMRQAMKEALEMIQQGRHADAAETLSAALEVPTDDVSARDAALEEAAVLADGRAQAFADSAPSLAINAKHEEATMLAKLIRALQSAPAQVVSKAKVREALEKHVHRETARLAVLHDLGVDLDATGET